MKEMQRSTGDPQDVVVYAWCERCGGEIYAPVGGCRIGRRIICMDCLAELLRVYRALYGAGRRRP